MSSKNIKIFDPTGCISEEALVEYVHGRLGVHLKKQVEIHINECDFCADALEGISLMENKEHAKAAIIQLNEKIANHGKAAQPAGKVIIMNYWRVAAAIAIFIVLGGGVLFVALNPSFKNEMAHNEKKQEEKTLVQTESVQPTEEIMMDSSVGMISSQVEREEMIVADDAEQEVAEFKELPPPAAVENKNEAQKSVPLDIKDQKPVDDLSKMTATGGYSNASTSYYNPQQLSGTTEGTAKNYKTPATGAAVAEDLNTTDVVVTSAKNKSVDKQSKREEATTQQSERRKAELEKLASEQQARASEEKKVAKEISTKSKNEAAAAANYDALKVADEYEEVSQARKNLEDDAMNISEVSAESEKDNDKVFAFVEQMPEYPGGTEALKKYISDNINYPQAAKDNNKSGVVYISYVVSKAGKVTKVKVWRSVDDALDKEAVRVISSVKNYTPGKQNGKPVDVQMTIPVKFTLE